MNSKRPMGFIACGSDNELVLESRDTAFDQRCMILSRMKMVSSIMEMEYWRLEWQILAVCGGMLSIMTQGAGTKEELCFYACIIMHRTCHLLSCNLWS